MPRNSIDKCQGIRCMQVEECTEFWRVRVVQLVTITTNPHNKSPWLWLNINENWFARMCERGGLCGIAVISELAEAENFERFPPMFMRKTLPKCYFWTKKYILLVKNTEIFRLRRAVSITDVTYNLYYVRPAAGEKNVDRDDLIRILPFIRIPPLFVQILKMSQSTPQKN